MKALDTPVLLELLRGGASARSLARQGRAEELATTEINLFELEALAWAGPKSGREGRRAAVERLRRKLTVLPIDERASRSAAKLSAGRLTEGPPTVWLMLAAADAAGCSEWVTTPGTRIPGGLPKMAVTHLGNKHAETRRVRNSRSSGTK